MMPASTKASSGVTVGFPDVCKVPSEPPPFTPIPYPNFAKTALAIQNKTPTGSKVVTGSTRPRVEIMELRQMINQLASKLLACRSRDPNQWQLILQEMVVAASALYVTMHHDKY